MRPVDATMSAVLRPSVFPSKRTVPPLPLFESFADAGAPVEHLSKDAPLFSYRYDLLFPQPIYFYDLTNCPGGGATLSVSYAPSMSYKLPCRAQDVTL